jgi:hypothetical protein
MKYTVNHDAIGTHIDWELEGVTARQLDWFWSNIEKGIILWHPSEHEPLEWAVPVKHGDPRGSVHIAPQTWSDGRRQNLYIRFEYLEQIDPRFRDVICHTHVGAFAGLGMEAECLKQPDPFGYRIHQWTPSDAGVVGKSTAIGTRKPLTVEDGKVWAAHCAEEIGNWGVFLPDLHRLYKVVTDAKRNPFADLSVTGKGRAARFAFMS